MITQDPRQFQPAEKRNDAQKQIYHVESRHYEVESQRKLTIDSEDALQSGGNKIFESNAQALYIQARLEGNDETEDKRFTGINHEESVSGQTMVNSSDSGYVRAASYYKTPVGNTSEKMDSGTNAGKTPLRPQDLVDKVSFGVAKVNVKSSAQYRKSYAFKIWKEKGCFPYRLADQPSIEERKKSKKYLNAIKAQRDRKNEEAWRAYKNFRVTSRTKTSQRAMQRLDEEIMKESMVHQNSISRYFKAKKDASLKSHGTPVTKSIPTSVIYINSTKSFEGSQPFMQAQRGTTKGGTEFRCENVPENGSRKSTKHVVITASDQVGLSRTTLPTGEESLGIMTNNLIQCPQRETTTRVSDDVFDQNIQMSRYVQAENHEETAATTMSDFVGHSNKTFKGRSTSSSADTQDLHGQQGACSLINKSEIYLNVTTKLKSLTNKCEKSSDQGDENIEDHATSGEKQFDNSGTVTFDSTQDQDNVAGRDGSRSPSNSSNLVAIMKNTLNQKYCKENVKPKQKSASIRGRKRRCESTSEEGEPQRGRTKQERSTVFTRLDEAVAINLADGIHNVNSEYFPIDALANKAAEETSKKIITKQNQPTKMGIKNKVEEIDRARLLLKELFDVTSESGQDHEMKTFDLASRSFGRKNILNHLSLLDRYFAEFQKKLSTDALAVPSTDSEII